MGFSRKFDNPQFKPISLIDKFRKLAYRARNENISIFELLSTSLRYKFARYIHWILFLVFPRYDYMGWRKRDLEQSLQGYLSRRHEPSNNFLWDLLEIRQGESVLEIGSNAGNRILELGRNLQTSFFHGIDINATAVKLGNATAEVDGLTNVSFSVTDISNPDEFKESKSYDVVFSWATLMYIHPRDILETLRIISGITSRKLVLIEQISDSKSKFSIFRKGTPVLLEPTWSRNYVELITQVTLRKFRSVMVSVPVTTWNPGGGRANALIIEFEA